MASRGPFEAQPPQRIISLVHDYANQQSRGERQLEELRKKNVELLPQLEVAEATLNAKKLQKNRTEEHLKGLEVELAAVETAVKARKARVHSQQDEIAHARLKLENVKQEETTQRESFTVSMLELNSRIRNLHDHQTVFNLNLVQKEPQHKPASKKENKMCQAAQIQLTAEEQQLAQLTTLYQDDEEKLKKIQMEVDDARKQEILFEQRYQEALREKAEVDARLKLMENISVAARELEDLSTQNANLEDMFSSLSEKLQKLQQCPKCGANNIGEFGGD